MCGILLVKSKTEIPIWKHLSALETLKSRGPDSTRYRYQNNIFIAQVVLHITGTDDYYITPHDNFLAYNGEIYNYQDFGPRTIGKYSNDIEFVDHAVHHNVKQLAQGWGPWAWAWTDNTTVRYAADPQGEKTLYQYQDKDILIVCSEVAPILEYIDAVKIPHPYVNKNWGTLDTTPWKGITRVTPGMQYINGDVAEEIDSIYNWIGTPIHRNINEAYEDFSSVWSKVTGVMTPTCPAGLTYSGGLDSSIILNSIDNLKLYAVNNTGKDPIVDKLESFLTKEEYNRLVVSDISESQWLVEYKEMLARLCMPAGSWSFVGQWIVNKSCKQRVLFTGAGADELFGGYQVYRTLDYNSLGSASPYSKHSDPAMWNSCLTAYNGDYRQATLLMDYWHQITGVDCRGIDLIGGSFGIEARNPFLAKPIMQLALNLPFDLKVSDVSKPIIRKAFLERWTEDFIFEKKGFTGHANDSFPLFESTDDRMADWKTIAQESFYEGKHI